MTGPKGEKIAAKAYSAAQTVNATAGPLDWGDKCFLCSCSINIDTPPVDSREFYVGKTGNMMLCHSRCIQEMNQAGGTPRAFHEARAAAGKPAVEPEPVQAAPPRLEQGASWLAFDTLADLTAYTASHEIPLSAKVTVGDSLVQPGE